MTCNDERQALFEWFMKEESKIRQKYSDYKGLDEPATREHKKLVSEMTEKARAIDKKYEIE